MTPSHSEPSKNPSLHTNYSLLNRIRDPNDEKSWKEFINYYEEYIYNILRRMGLNPSDAEELRQEINLKLWKHLPDFAFERNRGKFRQWLATVIKNDARKFYRDRIKKQSHLESSEDKSLEDFSNNIENSDIENLINSEWNSYISNLAWESIKPRLHEKTQKVFLLYAEGMDRKEIAKECDVSVDVVHVYIQRVRNHLVDAIEHFNSELL